ncbi:MAG: argininosuccinate lyase, partial [Chitinophagales bacterium]
MNLWQKDKASLKQVEEFTVGNDREMDLYLAAFDIIGSLAHIQMLQSIGLITKNELPRLQNGLKKIYSQMAEGRFSMQDDVEDI